MPTPVQKCADEVLDVIPLVMCAIRSEMRRHRSPGLSVPQFRALAFAGGHTGATLGELAEHLGLMPPAASAIVEGLVEMKLLERSENRLDRRRICLARTGSGREKLTDTRRAARKGLAGIFSPLPESECGQISNAMKMLRELVLAESGRHAAKEERRGAL